MGIRSDAALTGTLKNRTNVNGGGALQQIQLLQSACISMCRHMYNCNINIVECDVKQPIHLLIRSPLITQRVVKGD